MKDNKIIPKKKGGLGMGLNALLAGSSYEEHEIETIVEITGAIQEIAIEKIETNPYQPRTHFDEEALQELCDSIKMQGLIQPITVRRLSENEFQLISGERRLRASKMAGLTHIPAYIRTANDEQMLEFALIENIQRHDLNPLEVALAYKRLMDECQIVIEQVGEKVGKKRATVNNYLRLLKLPPEIQKGLKEGLLSMGHARTLITVDNPVIQLDIYSEILAKDLSVRQVEELVKNIGKPKHIPNLPPLKNQQSILITDLQNRLSIEWNTKVKISTDSEGKGEIKISFFSNEDLNRLLELLHS